MEWDRPSPAGVPRHRGRSALAAQPLARAALATPTNSPTPASRVSTTCRRDDGEPLVRPLARLAARRRRQAGGSHVHGPQGVAHQTFPLAPDFQGCAYHDPGHEVAGAASSGTTARATAGCAPRERPLSIGYYRRQDLPFLGKAAPAFTTCDRYFASFLGPTFPNRFYSLSGSPTAPTTRRSHRPADDLRPLRARSAFRLRTTTATSRSCCCTSAIPPSRIAGRRSSSSARREAAGVLVHRPELHLHRHRPRVRQPGKRRSPARGHPRRRVLHVADLQRGRAQPGLAAHAAHLHVRRMGRLLRPRAAARRAGREPGAPAARLPRPVHPRLTVRAPRARRPRGLRPHVDPEARSSGGSASSR